MATISVEMEMDVTFTPIPNYFLDHYMNTETTRNPIFVLVYLFFYKSCYHKERDITIENAAKELSILETDVLNSLKHWHKQKLIDFDEKAGSIIFKDVQKTSGNVEEKEEKLNVMAQMPIKIMETKPVYSIEELEIYSKQSLEIKNLFLMAENVLGKLLTYNDMSILFSFYDWLRLPIEVIEVLLLYCASNEHTNMRYIEKAALDWADNRINTIEKADEYIKLFNKDYREIMKGFGISQRNPTNTEIKYMKKWINEYKFSQEIILESCDQTIMRTGKSKFSYADKILSKWLESKVETIEDVRKLEQEFSMTKKEKAAPPPQKQNRFINFKQRKWDFEELEKNMLESNLNVK